MLDRGFLSLILTWSADLLSWVKLQCKFLTAVLLITPFFPFIIISGVNSSTCSNHLCQWLTNGCFENRSGVLPNTHKMCFMTLVSVHGFLGVAVWSRTKLGSFFLSYKLWISMWTYPFKILVFPTGWDKLYGKWESNGHLCLGYEKHLKFLG